MAKSKLSEYKEDYYLFTGKLSDINRQIAFAGIAIIWIFKETDGPLISVDSQLVLAAILIILALALDMVQYIYQSIAWSIFYTKKNKKCVSEDDLIESSPWMNVPSWIFFSFKVLFVIFAYVIIICFLKNKFYP